ETFLNFEYASFDNPAKISEGGFGVIYKAYFKDIKQIVVLKALDHDDEDDFIRE
ncbi:6306_t:CDS:1, partial [Racocetra persica]